MADRGRETARDALRLAVEGREPDLDRYLDAVPEMMLEARWRRQHASGQGTLVASIPVLQWVIPRLAVASAALVVAAFVMFAMTPTTVRSGPDRMEAMLLGQNGGELSTELILESIAEPGE
jgi:hypothetical protein